MNEDDIAGMTARYLDLKRQADANKTVAAKHAADAKVLNEEADGLREMIAEAVTDGGWQELHVPGVALITYRKPGKPAAIITDEAKLPEAFLLPQPPKPDKAAIREALIAGSDVPGATLANPKPSISIKELV